MRLNLTSYSWQFAATDVQLAIIAADISHPRQEMTRFIDWACLVWHEILIILEVFTPLWKLEHRYPAALRAFKNIYSPHDTAIALSDLPLNHEFHPTGSTIFERPRRFVRSHFAPASNFATYKIKTSFRPYPVGELARYISFQEHIMNHIQL